MPTPENDSSFVLRSINLPREMDAELRAMAFLLERPKSDLIRWCIARGLNELADRMEELVQRDIDGSPEWLQSDDRRRAIADEVDRLRYEYNQIDLPEEVERRKRDFDRMRTAIARMPRAAPQTKAAPADC